VHLEKGGSPSGKEVRKVSTITDDARDVICRRGGLFHRKHGEGKHLLGSSSTEGEGDIFPVAFASPIEGILYSSLAGIKNWGK